MCDDDCCCCSSVILGPIFGLFALIGMLCMTAGYVNNMNKNGAMVPATCKALSFQTLADNCYNGCCSTDSKGKCIGCYYTCYSGYVTASIDNITLGSVIKVYTNDYVSNVNAYLNVNYPQNKLFSCYYTFGSSVSIFLGLYDVQGPYIAGLVFLGLAAAVGLVWLIISFPYLLNCCGDCCGDCCSSCCNGCSNLFTSCLDPCRNCRRNMQKARERKDEERLAEAQAELKRQEKINQELQEIESQITKPPVHHLEQYSQNPEFNGGDPVQTTIQMTDEFSPPIVEPTSTPNASAPPLTESTYIEMTKL